MIIDIKTSFSKCQASQQDLVLETDGNFNHYKAMLVFSVSLFNSTLTCVMIVRAVQTRSWRAGVLQSLAQTPSDTPEAANQALIGILENFPAGVWI